MTQNIDIDIDDIMEKMELGWFHYRLLIICGLAFMSDAMEITLLSFISICAGSSWGLSNEQVASISSSVFVGVLLGNLFWGPFADYYGRRSGFILGSLIIIVFGIATGFAPNYVTLLCLRTMLGFGVGGATISFDLMAEFLPKSARGQFLTNINYFWTGGSMFVAGCAWVMLSSQGWHRLAIVTSLPVALSLIFAIGSLPESPRWLLLQGRVQEAEEIIRQAAAVNGSTLPPFSLRVDPESDETLRYHDKRANSTADNFSGFLQGQMLYISLPLWVIWVMFGLTYYGIILLTSRLYQHNDEDDDGFVCDFDYADIFYSAASEVAGVALTALVVDRYGRKHSQTSLYGLAAVGVILTGLPLGRGVSRITAIIARIASMAATSVTMVITPELFPTSMRASGHSVASSFARLGGFVTPFLVNSSMSIFLVALVLAIGNAIAMLFAFALPETKGLNLDDTGLRARSTVRPTLSLDRLRMSGDFKSPLL